MFATLSEHTLVQFPSQEKANVNNFTKDEVELVAVGLAAAHRFWQLLSCGGARCEERVRRGGARRGVPERQDLRCRWKRTTST